MKVIYLIRHAKSDWNNPSLTDFERPLNKRGLKDAPFMGEKLNVSPDLIIASPAKRVYQTIKHICKEINYSFNQIEFNESIYNSSIENLITVLNSIENNPNHVLLIGHNPGITLLSNYLTDDYINNMPTCSIVKIELEIDNWNEIIKGIGSKKYFIFPKMY